MNNDKRQQEIELDYLLWQIETLCQRKPLTDEEENELSKMETEVDRLTDEISGEGFYEIRTPREISEPFWG